MTDFDTTPERSSLMKRVRREGTAPEMIVRRTLHEIGGRYRVNVRSLPGSPDVANRRRKRAIFVHGCFWHWHSDCPRGTIPTRNRSFWEEKFRRNRQRDQDKVSALRDMGFRVEVVWECELGDRATLARRLRRFWFGE